MKKHLAPNVLIRLTVVGIFAALALLTGPAWAALNMYAALTLNGTALDGETTVQSMGGIDVSSDHLECVAVNHEIIGGDTGRPTHTPFKIVRRVDKASPLLYQALGQNQIVAGRFKFFRHNSETGEVEHYQTIEITQGRVAGIRQWFPNTVDAAAASYPHMEEVSFTYRTLKITSIVGGAEYVFDLSGTL